MISNEKLLENSISRSLRYDVGGEQVVYVFNNGEYLEARTEEELDTALAGGGRAISKNLFDSRSYGQSSTSVTPTSDVPDYFNLYTNLLNKTEEILSDIATETPEMEEELFVPTVEQAGQLVPFMKNKGNLLQIYVDTWAETGNDQLALQAVRDSDEYETYFPGNTRIDPSTGQGSGIRYTEAQYTALTDAYDRAFIEAGLNPDVFREAEVYPALVAGDVGSEELTFRINSARQAFVDNPLAEEVRAYYAQNFDIEMTDSALLASALDPSVGENILKKNISVAQIGAEASAKAFDITLQESERLYQLGVTGSKAAQLFSQAETLLGQVESLAAAQGRQQLGISEYLQAEAFGSPQQQQRFRNILAQQATESAAVLGARRTQQGAVTGLTEA
tara:strand:- start:33 stop:1205 length:1173 start_codon:yes stop_codon:yes gene_type:complete